MLKKILITLSLLIGYLNGYSQELFLDGDAIFHTRFRFIMLHGGVVILRGALDNHTDSLNFILDTGSGGISLDSTTAKRLKIKTEPSDKTIRGIAGIRKVDFAYNHTLKFPDLIIDSLNFHINDYAALSGIYGVKIDGIAGYSVLSRFILRLDYDNLMVEFYRPGNFKYPRGGQTLKPAIAGLPMLYAHVENNTKRLGRYYLDTGAGLCLLFSREYANDSGIVAKNTKFFTTVADGMGGKKEMDLMVVKKFTMSGFKFRNVPSYVFDDDFNVTQYPHLSGLIGNDLMRRFNVVINYPIREMHFLPNRQYKEAFDYSYTGMSMYIEDEMIYIIDVIKDSPADKAGVKPHDIVVTVNNNFSGDLQLYKTMLQDTGGTVNLILRRDKELVDIRFKIANIKKKKRG